MSTWNSRELIDRINDLIGDRKLPVLVRGEGVVAEIADIYIDHDHGDDSEFISIDLENAI